ncbi:thioredoxin domain-containing protein [Acanthamoeba castellanii mimivirus]|uniref:Thioredoxin domain-containing protein R443 n=6 Tax=Mimivirus TaxID=315393 RepID=TR443_MIMIV|nr:thioredoxin domain-containing protein [Acanthamoeba polyphaga mimivirus]Q5UQN5.1 RecName: Full=Thioredoxin domain-containing protein R443 [Acanthamoeba polyphaga mimivirus]AEQ60629.1 Thioredoxin [Acanthamoeba castellanii mamavirus]AHA45416.1 thioredoxin domain-containing protein [Hirudovirus strain Sangsue]ALR84033.1 thioredoxin [Niemeyer virus]AMZ02887.1 thioredoxin domain-containing protein [Mimivirus Bombay]EJN40879.1 hypothetical protein lvs_R375 [Acanthamoeba polyphaga lentillevirus]
MRKLSWQHIVLIVLAIILILWIISLLLCRKPVRPTYQVPIIQPMQVIQPHQNDIDPAWQTTYSPNNTDNQNQQYVLYYFNNPSCPHCKNFSSTWDMLKNNFRSINNLSLKEISTDKQENEHLVFYYNIRRVPTIILVTPDKNLEYSGNKSLEDLTQFIRSNMNQ